VGAGALAGMGAISAGTGLGGALAAGMGITGMAAGGTLAASAVFAAAGAIGGAVGSIVSQGVGMAAGIQQKFSWTGVASAALGGGLGGAGNLGIGNAAVRAMATNALSQGASIALGPQKKFNWASVAAAGVGSLVGGFVGKAMGPAGHGLASLLGAKTGPLHECVAGAFAAGLTGAASAIASAATRNAIDGTRFADGIRAAVPDVIGQMMSGFISACFTGETPVHTPLGLVRIDDIRVGDWVFSRDEYFGNARVQRRQVTALFRFENRAVLDITICAANGQSETLRTTPEHPFAILSAGPEARAISGPHRHTNADVLTRAYIWRAAGELEIGQHTVDIAGRTGTITAIEPAPGLTTVHNFAVDDLHTYFVGAAGVWVHNRYDAADEALPVMPTTTVTPKPWWSPIARAGQAAWNTVGFTAGVASGFLADTINGVHALLDFALFDVGGSVGWVINEGVNMATPGKQTNQFTRSKDDLVNAAVTGVRLWDRVRYDSVGLGNDLLTAYGQARADSNAETSPFWRGFTNPDWKVATFIATLPAVATKGSAVSKVGQVGSTVSKTKFTMTLANDVINVTEAQAVALRGVGLADESLQASASVPRAVTRQMPNVRPESSPHYSVFMEAKLRSGSLTASDSNHFRQGNRQLLQWMRSNPEHATALERQFPGTTAHIEPGPRGGVADTAPPGLTWHHDAYSPGNLQLIPRVDHQAPGPVQNTLHPNQQGGRQIWGGGRN
jgi:Pretoxin HINT domain/DNase/tRNase domain of colicin-like bacteriocin